jgi:large subunit ribosomal protein L30
MIAVVRVKGYVRTAHDMRETMALLGLDRINHMALITDTPTGHGMLKKVEFLITWGTIDDATLAAVLERRATRAGNRRLDAEFLKQHKAKDFAELAQRLNAGTTTLQALGIRHVFRLHPPRKGFERKGVKKSFSVGGVTGHRGEKINDLVMRMC